MGRTFPETDPLLDAFPEEELLDEVLLEEEAGELRVFFAEEDPLLRLVEDRFLLFEVDDAIYTPEDIAFS